MTSTNKQKAEQTLRKYWGYSAFRQGQAEAVHAVLDGKDTFVLFPTGGGKSICYQLPALVLDGLTLIISPLVALMQDQVEQLRSRNIKSAAINSSMSRATIEQTLLNARNGMYSMLYCSPERLQTRLFQEYAAELNLRLIAVDEAHCISEWGHDFRPAYREIRNTLRDLNENMRWMALTATATPKVQKDIVQNLGFEHPEIIALPFNRENLHWWVSKSDQKRNLLMKSTLRGLELGSGLIYCNTRRECDELVEPFSKHEINAAAYHAGKTSEERKQIQHDWIHNNIPLVACTSAFGMGIDKADCRFVIHKAHPYSLEAYYQEAGRAGRDGESAFPMLLYRESDYIQARKNLEENYPDREEVQKVYDCLCDELNLSVGEYRDEFQILNMDNVKKRSGLKMRKIRSALRMMQQFDVIDYQNREGAIIQLQFLLSSDGIADTLNKAGEKNKAEFTDQLIRHAGQEVFEHMVEVEADQLSQKMGISQNSLLKGLEVLSRHDRLLKYDYQSQSVWVKVLKSRSRNLPVDFKLIQQYRETLINKLEKMHQYVETEACREVFLRSYFGDTEAEDCGRCDNCLKKKDREGSFDPRTVSKLKQVLKEKSCTVQELMRELNVSKKALFRLLDHLQREDLIERVKEDSERYQLK